WIKGELRVVFSSGTGGFTQSAYTVNGLNICDMGLSVDDADATEAVGASTFSQPSGFEEHDISAIISAGGGILYFFERKSALRDLWQTMNYEEMLTLSLFCGSLSEGAKQPCVDVVEPRGLVRSQEIAELDGALWLTLKLRYYRVSETCFVQLHSILLGDGIFFQIVEPPEGCEGPKAPYRVAAQAELTRSAAMPRI
ncbi:MAG: hypothetical protein ACKVKF_19605, partial [Rhodobacterales bacterium]